MNSIPVSNSNQLRNDVSTMRPGDSVVFSVIRNELIQSISVILGERPSNIGTNNFGNENTIKYDILGLKVENYNIMKSSLLPINLTKLILEFITV